MLDLVSHVVYKMQDQTQKDCIDAPEFPPERPAFPANPGPTNVPDRILRAIDIRRSITAARSSSARPRWCCAASGSLQDQQPGVIFPASGTGAWEAALVNTLSPGDRVLMFETGHFASLWKKMADKLGMQVGIHRGDWRHGADPAAIEARLAEDRGHAIKAVCVVHNETSTGAMSRHRRGAARRSTRPATLRCCWSTRSRRSGSIDYRHDEWGVDVTVAGSQKGLMLPPGLSFNAVSDKALAASKTVEAAEGLLGLGGDAGGQRQRLLPLHAGDQPALRPSRGLRMLHEEGLDAVFARHARHGEATRSAVDAWGLEILCSEPEAYSGASPP